MTDKLRKLGKDKRDEVFSGKKTSGFTIIEVALVLAIAALIFLVVFLAVPALQKNQRDDGRKRDISNVVTALTTYYSNTNAFPAVSGDDAAYNSSGPTTSPFGKYLDPLSNSTLSVIVKEKGTALPTNNPDGLTANKETITVWQGYTCGNAPAAAIVAGNARNAVVVGMMEGSGGGTYCMAVQ